jgi:hypothetical protein
MRGPSRRRRAHRAHRHRPRRNRRPRPGRARRARTPAARWAWGRRWSSPRRGRDWAGAGERPPRRRRMGAVVVANECDNYAGPSTSAALANPDGFASNMRIVELTSSQGYFRVARIAALALRLVRHSAGSLVAARTGPTRAAVPGPSQPCLEQLLWQFSSRCWQLRSKWCWWSSRSCLRWCQRK